MPAEFGPVAEALTATEFPMVTSAGLTLTEFHVAQLNVDPLMRAEPASGAAVVHCKATLTFVVVRAVVLNVALPAHVTVPSVEVPESEIV
jgi:hypothetical protein